MASTITSTRCRLVSSTLAGSWSQEGGALAAAASAFVHLSLQLSVLADLCRCNLLLGTCNLINFPLRICILQPCDWILDFPTCILQLYIWDSTSRLVARNLQVGAAFEISVVATCKINTAAFDTSWQAGCFGQKTRIWWGSNKRIEVEVRLGLGLGLGQLWHILTFKWGTRWWSWSGLSWRWFLSSSFDTVRTFLQFFIKSTLQCVGFLTTLYSYNCSNIWCNTNEYRFLI